MFAVLTTRCIRRQEEGISLSIGHTYCSWVHLVLLTFIFWIADLNDFTSGEESNSWFNLNCQKKKLWVVDTQSIFLFIVSLNNSTISPPLPFSLLPPKIRKMRINPRKCITKMAPLWHLQVPTLCSSQADGNGICYIDEKKCMLREHGFYKSVKTLNLHLGLPAFFLLICVLLSQNFQCVLCLTREDQFNLDSLLDFIMLPEYILVFPYWLRQAKVNLFFWKCVHVFSDFWIPQIRNCLHFHKDLASLLIKPETFLFLYWCWVKKVEFASA